MLRSLKKIYKNMESFRAFQNLEDAVHIYELEILKQGLCMQKKNIKTIWEFLVGISSDKEHGLVDLATS